jgi:xylitol oxidase
MMIELIMVAGSRGGYALLEGYEERLADLEVRPHWGQYNTLTAERAAALYPHWGEWLEIERELNASGVFDSPFTRRLGMGMS